MPPEAHWQRDSKGGFHALTKDVLLEILLSCQVEDAQRCERVRFSRRRLAVDGALVNTFTACQAHLGPVSVA